MNDQAVSLAHYLTAHHQLEKNDAEVDMEMPQLERTTYVDVASAKAVADNESPAVDNFVAFGQQKKRVVKVNMRSSTKKMKDMLKRMAKEVKDSKDEKTKEAELLASGDSLHLSALI